MVTVGHALRVINVSNPGSPSLLGTVTLPGAAKDVVVRGTFAYVADFCDGSLQIVDLTAPSRRSGRYDDRRARRHPAGRRGLRYLRVRRGRLLRPRRRNGERQNAGHSIPRAILNFSAFRDDNATGIAIDGSYVYLTAALGLRTTVRMATPGSTSDSTVR